MTDENGSKKISINIRVTAEMHAAIQAIAEEQTRSIPLQVIYFVKRCIEEEKKP